MSPFLSATGKIKVFTADSNSADVTLRTRGDEDPLQQFMDKAIKEKGISWGDKLQESPEFMADLQKAIEQHKAYVRDTLGKTADPVEVYPGGTAANMLLTAMSILPDKFEVVFATAIGGTPYSKKIRDKLEAADIDIIPDTSATTPMNAVNIAITNGKDRIIFQDNGTIQDVLTEANVFTEERFAAVDAAIIPSSARRKIGEEQLNEIMKGRWNQDKQGVLLLPTSKTLTEENVENTQFQVPSMNLVLGNMDEASNVYLDWGKRDENGNPEKGSELDTLRNNIKIRDTLQERESELSDAESKQLIEANARVELLYDMARKRMQKQLNEHQHEMELAGKNIIRREVAFITDGSNGAYVINEGGEEKIRHIEAGSARGPEETLHKTGAGDTAFGAFYAAYIVGWQYDKAAEFAMHAADAKLDYPESRLSDVLGAMEEKGGKHEELAGEMRKSIQELNIEKRIGTRSDRGAAMGM